MPRDKSALLKKAETTHWATPLELYAVLNSEFRFDHDPCPLNCEDDGCDPETWGQSNYINPPYGPAIKGWLSAAVAALKMGKRSVFLLPARTDTKWWHDYVLPFAQEIRFIKGRLTFIGAPASAPFPSVIVIFEPPYRKGFLRARGMKVEK